MRFAIKNAAGAHFTGSDIVGSKDSIEADGTGTKHVHSRHVLAPKFDGHAKDCSKFDTEQDANDMMKHQFLQDPKSFDGCTVVPIES
jgi:hypothetical protein